MENNIVLIITGCINPVKEQNWLYIKDKDERLRQYLESIRFYLTHCIVRKIVFCENSNYACFMAKQALIKLAKDCNKQLEWLGFNGDSNLVKLHGKGYGEAEIMNYVCSHSSLLKESTQLVKVTGRLIVKNINEIILSTQVNSNYFYRDIYRSHLHGVDTRCYICNIEYFKGYLNNCYEKVKNKNLALEDAYFILLGNNFKAPKEYLRIYGISGGNGRVYGDESKFFLKIFDMLCTLGVFNTLFPLWFVSFKLWKKLKIKF